ncbi:DUF3078 domain-containing protein [Corallibacter sp.]|uniref:DUF3078 domain-containing protein n=1 Tax=Corallibacter sp. TaxID=2038084 RepID=UPI003AB4A51E
MRQIIIVTVLFFSIQFSWAQPDSLYFKPEIVKPAIPVWELKNKAGLDISEVAFVNWNAGGSNSISALVGVVTELKYRYKNFIWNNIVQARYGINSQQGQKPRKTDDLMDISSTLGFRKDTLTNWYYSARFNFKSQFSNGYNYPNTSKEISKFMAPGYLFVGGGIEYGKNIETFSMYFSPLTLKSTFVLDKELANAGAFGVEGAVYNEDGSILTEGEQLRMEFGILFTSAFEKEVFKNIHLMNFVSFYTDYLNNFGNVDVDWQVNFNFKVNDFVKATLGSHLKYDDDVKTLEPINAEETEFVEAGAKVQWKQMLGVGVVVDF